MRKLYQAPTVPIYDMAAPPRGNHLLQVNEPDLDDFSPILYWQFPVPRTIVWERITYRPDVFGATDHHWFMPYLVFKQYFDNQDYYGALGTGANYIGGAGRCHDPGSDLWDVDPIDSSADPVGSPILNHYWTGNAAIMDFHMEYVGDVGGANRWLLELWVDETNLVASQEFDYTPDPPQASQPFISLGGLVLTNNYGDSAGSTYWDNLMLGTSQGLSNILAVQDFESGPFGALLEADDGSLMRDSFAIVVEPS